MLLYRAMIEVDEKPLVVQTARGLGFREGEIEVDEDGICWPGTGGPSVALYDPGNLVIFRRPPALGGTGIDTIWEIDDEDLGDTLLCRKDPANPLGHGFLEPVRPTPVNEYLLALAETSDVWRKWG